MAMSNRMERFTQLARRTLSGAQEQAIIFKDSQIRVQHVLLALLSLDEGVAYHALTAVGMRYEIVFEAVTKGSTPEAKAETIQPELSVGVKRLLEQSVAEARKRGHHYIGSEHLLLGMIAKPEREISELLRELKITPDAIKKSVEKALSEPLPHAPVKSIPFAAANQNIKITVTPKASAQQETFFAQFPLNYFLEQLAKGEQGTLRLENESYSLEITIE